MKELTDKCEHCGNLNRSGALHCDICGKGLSANLAVMFKKYTRKTCVRFILCGVSAIVTAVMIIALGDTSSALFAILTFLAFGSFLVFLSSGISSLSARSKYRYSDNAELALEEKPENGESGKPRLNDEELVKSMDHYSKRMRNFLLLSLPILAAAIVAFSITGEEFSVYSSAGIVLTIIFLILVAKAIISGGKVTEVFKVNVVCDALAGAVDGCVYRPELSISRQRIEATDLFSGWNKFRGNDYIRGMYNGHQIEISDIHLEEEYETGSGDNTETVTRTIFQGPWITCRLGRKLPAVVRLREGSDKGNAETENVAFNSKYAINTDDPHYMFYVLTPHFMEYITAADEAAKARTFFYFAGDTAHIAIDNRHDAFEVPANKEARNNPAIARERIKSEMKYITDILDVLLLNKNLFDGNISQAQSNS